jgi:hypothetical protein
LLASERKQRQATEACAIVRVSFPLGELLAVGDLLVQSPNESCRRRWLVAAGAERILVGESECWEEIDPWLMVAYR